MGPNVKLLAIAGESTLSFLRTTIAGKLPWIQLLTASDEVTALEVARSEEPGVILIECALSSADAPALCRKLKADRILQTIPVLLLTSATTDGESRAAALEAGAEGFLCLPFDEVDLGAQLRVMARIKQQQTDLLAARASEAYLKEAQETARLGSWTYHHLTGLVSWSEEEYRMFGCSPDTFTPTLESFLKAVHPEDQPAILQWTRACIAGKNPGEIEFRAIRPDGSVRYVTSRGKMYYNAASKASYLSGTSYDITERKQAEAELRASENLFRDLFEHHSAVKLLIDPTSGNVLDANKAAAAFYGWPRETLRQMKIQDIGTTTLETLRQQLVEGPPGKAPCAQYRHRRADGAVRDVEIFSGVIEVKGKTLLHLVVVDITERRLSEAERERLQTAIWQSADIIVITDAAGTIEFVNPAFERVSGYTREEVLGRNVSILKSGYHEQEFYTALWRTISDGQVWRGRLVNKRKDGALYTDEVTISPVRDTDGAIVNYVSTQRDITEQLRLEADFRQAQKMESVGRLAGGIAHDFNNLLTVINGYSQLLLEDLAPADPLYARVETICKTGERAARLTRQLLSFSRKEMLERKAFELDPEIAELKHLLSRLLGEDIEICLLLGAPGAVVHTDPHQLGQAILNLAVNAKDSMPLGGTLTIQTLAADEAASFVRIEVSDTGAGMSEETRQRIFEPFFTTKEAGKGTGLGLAMVHGFVQQSGGRIEVSSVHGAGATFRIDLPRVAKPSAATAQESVHARGGSETLLVVEDQAEALNFTATVLEAHGYHVLRAAGGIEALQLCEQHAGPVHLLLTDVVMPKMRGPELARRIAELRPGINVIYMSGYTGDVITLHGVEQEGAAYLQKPFRPEQLAAKVRASLDSGKKAGRVLIADDEPEVRRFLRAVLEKSGYEVTEAENGRQAIEQARARPVDLMIVDLVMPEQEGLATISALRKEMPAVFIIAISGGFGSDFLHVARKIGADAVMSKPLSAAALLTHVADLLQSPR